MASKHGLNCGACDAFDPDTAGCHFHCEPMDTTPYGGASHWCLNCTKITQDVVPLFADDPEITYANLNAEVSSGGFDGEM